ncbi:ABC transporter substrate-binding protein [Algicola sagamiensis]|uniref:ABC transporter substrate-binding protein n=1 Tax=Algicola sagamiensis TaxID=163869 RepID=UPI000362E1FC|nr:ABC transporter substrate-binding protein [Algicola sagamiensis]
MKLTFLALWLAAFSAKSTPDAFVIALNDWSSQRVLSKVTGKLIQQMDIPVRYQDILTSDQWGGLKSGVVHFQVEVWQSFALSSFQTLVEAGHILDLGDHAAKTREEWWYPKYVEKVCPGLPDWQALKKCAALFRTPTSGNKGVFLTGNWLYNHPDRIRALQLNFTIERVKSDQVLWKRLSSAQEAQKPIVLLNWTPNWTQTRLSGNFIEFPTYHPDCKSKPSWGVNPKHIHDCGSPKNGWLKKAAWPEIKTLWPCAYDLLKNMSMNSEMISEAAALVDTDGMSEEQAASTWLKKFPSAQHWIPKQCRVGV